MATESLPRRRLSGLKNASSSSGGSHGGSSSNLNIHATTSNQQHRGDDHHHLLPPPPSNDEHAQTSSTLSRRIAAFAVATLGIIAIFALSSGTDFSGFSWKGLRAGGTHLPHHRALAEAGISKYELLPEFTVSNEPVRRVLESAGSKSLELELKVLNNVFDLELKQAQNLFAQSYRSILINLEDGNTGQVSQGQVDCIYDAAIKGDPASFGSVSLCGKNIQVIMFHHSDEDRSFTVAPLDQQVHVAYRHLAELDEKRHLRVCPDSDGEDNSRRRLQKASSSKRDKASKSPIPLVGRHNKTVRLAIVNDAKRFLALGDDTEANTATIVHAVNAFYRSLYSETMYGIQFKLVSQLTFQGKDQWNTTAAKGGEEVDSQRLLDDFYEWKRSSAGATAFPGTQPDLIQLYSGHRFDAGLVGRAAQAGITEDGGICGRRNVGVCQMSGFDMGLYAKISAHELGHALSLPHDGKYSDPECRKDQNTFMAAGISLEQGTHFSRCSLDTMKTFFAGGASFPYKGCLEREGEDA